MTASNRLFNFLVDDESSVSSDVENSSRQMDKSNGKSRVKAIIEDSLYEDCLESPLNEIDSNTNRKRDSNMARQFQRSIVIDDTKSDAESESKSDGESESDQDSKTENNNQTKSESESNSEDRSENTSEDTSESNSEETSESNSEETSESNSEETSESNSEETSESNSEENSEENSESNSDQGSDRSVDKSSSDDVQIRKVNKVKRNVLHSDSEDDDVPKSDGERKQTTPKTAAPVSKETIENSPDFEIIESAIETGAASKDQQAQKREQSILSSYDIRVDKDRNEIKPALQTPKRDDSSSYLNEESFTKMKSNLDMMNPRMQKASYDDDNDVLNDSDPVELSNINENTRESILSSTKYHISSDLKKNDKPLASWSPNFEKVKSKLKQSQMEREQQQRKIQIIELSDGEDKKSGKKSQQQPDVEIIESKVDANAMLMKLQKQFDVPRNSTKQVQNRNIGFEEKLKVLSENMLQVMECKPDQSDDVHYQPLPKQPTGMKVKLLPHQCYSMRWLKWREENYPNGAILADDMGLGKTLTVLAYLRMIKDLKHEAIKEKLKMNDDEDGQEDEEDDEDQIGNKYLSRIKCKKSQKSSSRKLDELVPPLKTLIILPASLLCQWQSEIKSKFEANVFKVYCYHDAQRKKYAYNLDANDIVFTTYEIVSREIDLIDDESAYKAASASPLIKIKWKRIILDEAHRIKNHTTKANKSICQLRAKYRIALTGTPIHNSLNDLYSLVKFLHFDPLSDFSLWKYIFASETSNKLGSSNSATSVERMKRLDSWMVFLSDYLILRRTKEDKLHSDNQKPIVDLPGKSIETIKFPLNMEEKAIYMKIFNESKEKVNKILMSHQQRLLGRANVNANGNLSDIFVYLLRLRQACCHMSLLAECLDKDELQKIKLETEGIEGLMSNLNINENSTTKNESASNEMLDLNSVQVNVDLSKCLRRSYKSSKLTRLIDMVEELLEKYPDDKMIIVSQWTSMLSLVAKYLQANEIEYCEIKGDINLAKRNEIVEDFNRESNVSMRVMLLSLTAGGVGLNLVGANRMFLLDIHWNPALEHQASDRIYRVGQRKPCTIYRFLCENTIEERIRQIQEFKLQLANKVCSAAAASSLTAGGTGTTAASKLTLRDFKLLFTDFE